MIKTFLDQNAFTKGTLNHDDCKREWLHKEGQRPVCRHLNIYFGSQMDLRDNVNVADAKLKLLKLFRGS